MTCNVCGKSIVSDWRKDRKVRKTPLLFCSRSCSNKRVHSKQTRQKISESLTEFKATQPKCTVKRVTCCVCGEDFDRKVGSQKKSCSAPCTGFLLSVKRQAYIKQHGTFSTLRESFTYGDATVDVDSNLEKAAIKYLVDHAKATRICRYENILNYWEGESHRTYNPDFICQVDGQTCIVEVKMKWSDNSNHSYNRSIPFKRQALDKYCRNNGFKMLWLDFETTPQLRTIYKSVLNDRQ